MTANRLSAAVSPVSFVKNAVKPEYRTDLALYLRGRVASIRDYQAEKADDLEPQRAVFGWEVVAEDDIMVVVQ